MEDFHKGEGNNELSERLLSDEPVSGDVVLGMKLQGDDIGNHNNNNNNNTNDNNDLEGTGGEIIIVDPLHAGHGLRGENQTPEYRDAPFAIGFVLHLTIILFLALSWGTKSLKQQQQQEDDNNNNDTTSSTTVSLWGFLWLLFLTSLASVGMGAAALELFTSHAEEFIQLSLMASCTFLGLTVLVLFSNGASGVAFVWLFVLVFTILNAIQVWHRIPFAAANLKAALSAIQTNYGVCMLAYAIALASNIWMILWVLAFLGVNYKESSSLWSNSTACENGSCKIHIDPFSLIILLLSYHWTSQVMQNVLHVTIAGVIGTWWFAPQEANSVFSPAIQDSFRRATSYSFGSICMGSLLVAIIQTLEQLVKSVRRNNQRGILLCILECLLRYISEMARYFNKWAFIYVGLYGYDYRAAGRKVLELFQQRGWTTIINDNLVHRTLVLICLVISALTGLVGMFLAKMTGWAYSVLGDSDSTSAKVFVICTFMGLSLAFILMGVVLSGVDSVIVCFAEAPEEFETNHPALSQQMMRAWRQVYPQESGF